MGFKQRHTWSEGLTLSGIRKRKTFSDILKECLGAGDIEKVGKELVITDGGRILLQKLEPYVGKYRVLEVTM